MHHEKEYTKSTKINYGERERERKNMVYGWLTNKSIVTAITTDTSSLWPGASIHSTYLHVIVKKNWRQNSISATCLLVVENLFDLKYKTICKLQLIQIKYADMLNSTRTSHVEIQSSTLSCIFVFLNRFTLWEAIDIRHLSCPLYI